MQYKVRACFLILAAMGCLSPQGFADADKPQDATEVTAKQISSRVRGQVKLGHEGYTGHAWLCSRASLNPNCS